MNELPRAAGAPNPRTATSAEEILASHPAVDLHCDTIDRVLAGHDLLDARDPGQATPRRLMAGGFGTALYVAWIPPHLGPERGWARLLRMVTATIDLAREARERLGDRAPALLPALEDARVLYDPKDPAGGVARRVDALSRFGVRYVTLTWNSGNRFATSCEDTRDGGLTPEGHALIARLDAAGIRVDVSHLSDRAALEAIARAKIPPIASHSSSRSLARNPRNVSDELARAIAARGGVVGVNVHRPFLSIASREADLDRVVAHVEHLFDVAGEEAVAFGSDFDGIPVGPTGLSGADEFPRLVARLLGRGHAIDRIARFLRGNAARALDLTPTAVS